MLELGTMLSGRYEVLKRVGSGGMADVYMAKDHKLNRNVAVKVLKSEYVEEYLKEGDFSDDGSIKIFPVAKSTELLFFNDTDWQRIQAEIFGYPVSAGS